MIEEERYRRGPVKKPVPTMTVDVVLPGGTVGYPAQLGLICFSICDSVRE